jgi:hypothetical protein
MHLFLKTLHGFSAALARALGLVSTPTPVTHDVNNVNDLVSSEWPKYHHARLDGLTLASSTARVWRYWTVARSALRRWLVWVAPIFSSFHLHLETASQETVPGALAVFAHNGKKNSKRSPAPDHPTPEPPLLVQLDNNASNPTTTQANRQQRKQPDNNASNPTTTQATQLQTQSAQQATCAYYLVSKSFLRVFHG